MEKIINGVPYSTMAQITVKEDFKYHLAADALKDSIMITSRKSRISSMGRRMCSWLAGVDPARRQ